MSLRWKPLLSMFSKHKLMQYLLEEKRLEEGGGVVSAALLFHLKSTSYLCCNSINNKTSNVVFSTRSSHTHQLTSFISYLDMNQTDRSVRGRRAFILTVSWQKSVCMGKCVCVCLYKRVIIRQAFKVVKGELRCSEVDWCFQFLLYRHQFHNVLEWRLND